MFVCWIYLVTVSVPVHGLLSAEASLAHKRYYWPEQVKAGHST